MYDVPKSLCVIIGVLYIYTTESMLNNQEPSQHIHGAQDILRERKTGAASVKATLQTLLVSLDTLLAATQAVLTCDDGDVPTGG